MISVQEALAILEEHQPAPRIIHVALDAAHGRRLAREVTAPEPSPRYTNSAMDGFAVRWQDLNGLGDGRPVFLTLAGESQAGVPYQGIVNSAAAIRISTGAMLPQGTDTVIRVEDTEEKEGGVLIKRCKKQGQDVRYQGEEFAAETVLLAKGLLLKARQIALLAAVGIKHVPVFDLPRVTLFITGTELAHHSAGDIQPFQVRDSNSPMLQAAVKEAGGSLLESLVVEDDPAATTEQMARALANGSDLILCSGGVSVGRHDHIKTAAKAVGFTELFWKIRQKPGKPLYFAKKEKTLLFGLPGNPVSAFMCFQNFVIPVLESFQGRARTKQTITAVSEVNFSNQANRTDFIRITILKKKNEMPTFRPIANQGSHMLTSIVQADGYIPILPGCNLRAGELAEVYVF